ncbi:MAG: rhodanese-like domain-containing protein [Acidimicrobiia bacterium]
MNGVTVPEVDVQEAARLQAEGMPVFDVREPDEYEAGHAAGAVLIPLGELPDRLAEIPLDRPVLLICRSGARSGRATAFVNEQGGRATNVGGGTLAWVEAGLPTVTGPNA